MKKFSQFFSRKSLLTIYRSFVQLNLSYADIIYDKPLNESFEKKIELVQYNVKLIITDAIKGTCHDKILSRTRFGIFDRLKMEQKTYFLSQNNRRFATFLPAKLSHSI